MERGKKIPSERPALGRCPTCSRAYRLDSSPTPPFCSERCQLIDLGRWLDEEIGLPYEGDATSEPPHGDAHLDDDASES